MLFSLPEAGLLIGGGALLGAVAGLLIRPRRRDVT